MTWNRVHQEEKGAGAKWLAICVVRRPKRRTIAVDCKKCTYCAVLPLVIPGLSDTVNNPCDRKLCIGCDTANVCSSCVMPFTTVGGLGRDFALSPSNAVVAPQDDAADCIGAATAARAEVAAVFERASLMGAGSVWDRR